MRKIPLVRRLERTRLFNPFFTSTVTFEIHEAPGDYYRFSRQAFEEVFFAGMDDVTVECVMVPPRLIGIGRRPRA